MGLSCFEYSFGRGVSLSNERALSIGAAFKDAGVEISVHAPYYINFANPDQEMVEKSYMYVLQSAEKVKLMGGKRVVFHPASQGKMKREQAVDLTYERLNVLRDKIYENGFDDLIFCPETMGKINQLGDSKEIIQMCKVDKRLIPTIDFGHLYARSIGTLNTYELWMKELSMYIEELGYDRMKNFHAHFSHMEYTPNGGEKNHVKFSDEGYGPDFNNVCRALIDLKLEPRIICESAGTQDVDSKMMKDIYLEMEGKNYE